MGLAWGWSNYQRGGAYHDRERACEQIPVVDVELVPNSAVELGDEVLFCGRESIREVDPEGWDDCANPPSSGSPKCDGVGRRQRMREGLHSAAVRQGYAATSADRCALLSIR
jgi:hypothetical protein